MVAKDGHLYEQYGMGAEMSADMDSKRLTINNLDKLKGKAIGLYNIDDVLITNETYQIRGVMPIHLTKDCEVLRVTIGLDVKYNKVGVEVCHHRMLRATLSPRGHVFESKEFELPVHHMNEMRVWLNWMGAFETGDGWKEENL